MTLHYRNISDANVPTFASAALVSAMVTFRSLRRLVKAGTVRCSWHKRKTQKKCAPSRL